MRDLNERYRMRFREAYLADFLKHCQRTLLRSLSCEFSRRNKASINNAEGKGGMMRTWNGMAQAGVSAPTICLHGAHKEQNGPSRSLPLLLSQQQQQPKSSGCEKI